MRNCNYATTLFFVKFIKKSKNGKPALNEPSLLTLYEDNNLLPSTFTHFLTHLFMLCLTHLLLLIYLLSGKEHSLSQLPASLESVLIHQRVWQTCTKMHLPLHRKRKQCNFRWRNHTKNNNITIYRIRVLIQQNINENSFKMLHGYHCY